MKTRPFQSRIHRPAFPARHQLAITPLAALLLCAPLGAYANPASSAAPPPPVEAITLDEVRVTAPRPPLGTPTLGATVLEDARLLSRRPVSSDSARLLQDIPGVSLYGAGAISSLPAIHGLADDRLRIQVDGVDLMAACPNHMNSALSYIDPSQVASITVFAGVTPVSVGGDSIGGTVQVTSAPPEFADPGTPAFAKGQAGTFYRSNGQARGYNAGATWVGHGVNLSYAESESQAGNYSAGGDFKAVKPGQEGGPLLPGDEVGSSAYRASKNQTLGLALQHDGHLLALNLGRQTVGFEGFPNQRMDMTANTNRLLNLRYSKTHAWGEVEARFYDQDVVHKMDMGPDRHAYGTGMPMDSKAHARGALVQASVVLSERDLARLGAEYQNYTLYDWWPPVGGSMGPNAFWNIDYGQRNKVDLFAEWEARWSPQWLSQWGLRSNTVMSNAAAVQGYNNSLAGLWGQEAAAFNASDRQRTDRNWDLTALARYTPSATRTFEGGYARKTRSPNVYQRYAWSTQPMAALMNNFVGDGNGYLGNLQLKPEVAHTVSATGDWHDENQEKWQLKATAYYTYIQDYMDARRCDFSQCSPANVSARRSFVLLQYANQSARLYGLDLSGQAELGRSAAWGTFTASGVLAVVHGRNQTTSDGLYNLMPINAKLALEQRVGAWHNTAEVVLVGGKSRLSQVRNEMPTGGYGLLNVRSRYTWKQVQLSVGVENLFNRAYALPLGGAYVGQGASMTSNGIAWGVPVAGMGRSVQASVNVSF